MPVALRRRAISVWASWMPLNRALQGDGALGEVGVDEGAPAQEAVPLASRHPGHPVLPGAVHQLGGHGEVARPESSSSLESSTCTSAAASCGGRSSRFPSGWRSKR